MLNSTAPKAGCLSIPRTALARVSAKAVMDSGRGDRRVTGGNRELVKVANDVPGRIEVVHACPLLRVDDHIADLRTISVEAGCQF
jgi:hypothetical protein